jgi:hypothetical protein
MRGSEDVSVLKVDQKNLEDRFDKYPHLKRIFRERWVATNLHDPLWKPPIHPFMISLISGHNDEFCAAVNAAVGLLIDENVVGKRELFSRLKSAQNFRTALPELLITTALIRDGYDVVLPVNHGEKRADLHVSRDGSEALVIEVTCFEQTKDLGNLNVMLAMLRATEPIVYRRSIPDTARISSDDVAFTVEQIQRILADGPVLSSHEIRVGASGFTIRIEPEEGQGSVNVTQPQPNPLKGARRINGRLLIEAKQLPLSGGAVILDIATADEHVNDIHHYWETEPDVRDALWRGVPDHLHSLWLYRTRYEDAEIREVRFTTNPHTTVPAHPLVAELCSGVLKPGYFPYPQDDWWADDILQEPEEEN